MIQLANIALALTASACSTSGINHKVDHADRRAAQSLGDVRSKLARR